MVFSHPLKSAFIPRSVAVVGASDRKGSRGTLIWNGVMNSHRILQAYPVNPKYKYIGLTPCWAKLSELPEKVDLVVIATPTSAVQQILRQCASLDIQNVLITPGEDELTSDRLWRRKTAEFCQNNGIRLIGPGSLGLIRPQIGLNVSYWPTLPRIGHVGLICQSSSMAAAVLDYATRAAFGFSSVLTAGAESDVTLAQMLDFLADDPDTEVIAMHIETLVHPRAFFSALRAASRTKPVIVLKTGRGAYSARLIASRYAMPACDDGAFDAMLERTACIRCDRVEDFCASIELFSTHKDAGNGQLALVANGLGFSALAADATQAGGISLASLSDATSNALSKLTGQDALLANPVDLGFEAAPALLSKVVKLLLTDKTVDAILLTLSPTATADIDALIPALEEVLRRNSFKPVILVWMGDTFTETERNAFSRLHVPVLHSIDSAVRAYRHLYERKKARELTLQAPRAGSEAARHDFGAVRDIIEEARNQKRNRLTPEQCERLLHTIGIPSVKGSLVTTASDAVAVAKSLEGPVALKICAEGLEQRSRIGGIILNSTDIAKDFTYLKRLCAKCAPLASFTGILVQKMSGRPNARELKLSLTRDPVLGPVLSLSAGGKIGELFPQKQLALAPLTEPLARNMVERSIVYSALEPFRGQPKVDIDAIVNALMELSRLATEIPGITELEINPLIADERGVLALDTTAGFSPNALVADETHSHMLIAPAPNFTYTIDSTLRVRTLRADDVEALKAFASRLSEKTAFLRLQKRACDITDEEYMHYTQLDYDRERAYALVDTNCTEPEIHAVARFVVKPELKTAEFGLVIEDAFQNRGLGTKLMKILLTEASKLGAQSLFGVVLVENEAMKKLLTKLKFIPEAVPNNNDIRLYRKVL